MTYRYVTDETTRSSVVKAVADEETGRRGGVLRSLRPLCVLTAMLRETVALVLDEMDAPDARRLRA